ncbi:MAG TPA: DUF3426 domain-containing protein [Burkholderiales bacterium]|nr:DUF3426 domain-containing protein [Burkholderiales bacterium]
MSMVTRCPHCSTSFRITSDLLKMRHGMVRCGHCSEVFNAFDSLSTVHDDSAEKESVAEAIPGLPPEEPATEAASAEAVSAEIALRENVPFRIEPSVEEENASPVDSGEEASEEFLIWEKPPRFRWAWKTGSALLLLVLLGQSAYYFRMEIGIAMPGMKPFLHDYCRLLECTVPLPSNAKLIGIEYSSLHAETGRAGVIALNASIRNGASYAQAYPLIELTLTDSQDGPLARKIFSPSDYLQKDARIDEGIPPDSAVNVSLNLDTGSLQPAGYRLYLFYP